jgi:hypothetical protein
MPGLRTKKQRKGGEGCDQLNVLTEPDQEKLGLNKPRTGALIPLVTFRVIQKWSWMKTERKIRMLERVRRAFRTIGRLEGLRGCPTSASEERMGRKEKEEEMVNYSAGKETSTRGLGDKRERVKEREGQRQKKTSRVSSSPVTSLRDSATRITMQTHSAVPPPLLSLLPILIKLAILFLLLLLP